MKKLHIRRIAKRIEKNARSELIKENFLLPAVAGQYRIDHKVVRAEILHHVASLMPKYVVLRFSFRDHPIPMLLPKLDHNVLTDPRRWLRGKAAQMRKAGAIFSAGCLHLRLSQGGWASFIGFDVELELLVVCAEIDAEAIRLILTPKRRGPTIRRWPRNLAAVETLRTLDAVKAAAREIWNGRWDVAVDEPVAQVFATPEGGFVRAQLQKSATAGLRRLGDRGLSCYSGLARNGERVVLTPATKKSL